MFQTEELSMWIIQRNAVSDEQQYSILRMENRFRSGGIGKLKKIYAHLYQNRWISVNHYRGFRLVVIYSRSIQFSPKN